MLAAFAVALISVPSQVPACTPLQQAALAGDDATVQHLAGRRLLGMGPPVAELELRSDAAGPCFRRTPLMLAAEHGSADTVKILISSGARLDAVALLPELGDEALDARCLAIANNQQAVAEQLEKAGAKPMACTDNALLFAGLAAGQPDVVERQLRAHPSAATLNAVLLTAAGKRRGKAVDLLIAAGLERKLDFRPVYTAAVAAGDLELVKQLSSGGARLTDGDVLAQAIAANHAMLIGPLVTAGARTRGADVTRALTDALIEKRTAVVLALVDTGYRADADFPMLVRAIESVPAIAPALVKAGVGVEVDDLNGTTPLMAAAIAGDAALAQLLIDRGASPRTADVRCYTANDLKRQGLVLAALASDGPLPGRAARAHGVTCGEARIKLNFAPSAVSVYLAGAQDPISPNVEYRVDPGNHVLRLKFTGSDVERKMALKLAAGTNTFSEAQDFTPSGTHAMPDAEAPRAPTRAVANPGHANRRLELREVLDTVELHRGDVAKCLKGVKKKDGESPILLLQWQVSAEGDVMNLQPLSPPKALAAALPCITGAVKKWKFSTGSAPTEPITVPFPY